MILIRDWLGFRLNLERPVHPDSIVLQDLVSASTSASNMTFACYSVYDTNIHVVLENPDAARTSDDMAEGVIVRVHPEDDNSYLHYA